MAHVELACTVNKPYLPVLKTQQLVYVYIEAQATDEMTAVRNPLNLSMVLDRSGSMEGEKIANLRDAAKLVIGLLDDDDYVAITAFSDRVFKIAPSQLAADRAGLGSVVDSIRDGGGTAMSRGMRQGKTELEKNLSPDRVNRMLLLTDGQTFGDEDECRQLGAEMGDQGIVIQALGLGEDWNEDLLDEVAEASGGKADFIENPDEIAVFFQEAVQRMQGTVVQNAELVLRLVNGIVPRQVWRVTPMIENLGYTPLSDRDVQVDLGEMDKDEGISLLVELLVSPRPAGTFRIAQAEIAYDVPALNLVGEKARVDVMLNFTTDPEEAKAYDAATMNLVEKVTAFKLQTRALNAAKMGDAEGASRQLRAAATRLLQIGEHALAEAALEEAQNLDETGAMTSGGTKKLHYATRKLTRKPRGAEAADAAEDATAGAADVEPPEA